MADLKAINDISTYRKIADAAYRRGRSGFSVKDEQDAAKYQKLKNDAATEVMGETGSTIRTPADIPNAVGLAGANWMRNLSTERGREINAKNMAFMEADLAKIQAKRIARNKAKE